mmetsp:Transcript_95235/g.269044  ORF Transcript_95235/g.269044 Transcript_95235/m.269044 type:complete len:201 (-) Transcript_95235:28-630(-)
MERAFITWFTPSGPTAVATRVSDCRRMLEMAPATLLTLVRAETFTVLWLPMISGSDGRGWAGIVACCMSCCSAVRDSSPRMSPLGSSMASSKVMPADAVVSEGSANEAGAVAAVVELPPSQAAVNTWVSVRMSFVSMCAARSAIVLSNVSKATCCWGSFTETVSCLPYGCDLACSAVCVNDTRPYISGTPVGVAAAGWPD